MDGRSTISPENIEVPKQRKRKVAFVETSDLLEQEARDTAEARMAEDKAESQGVKGFFKKIWKHSIWEEYYRQKELNKARNQILETGNLYAGETGDSSRHELAMASIAERFASEYDDEVIHTDAGEVREVLEDGGINARIKETILAFARGELSEADFVEEKNRIFSELQNVSPEIIDRGVFHADNLLEIAHEVKLKVEHGAALEALDLDFEVVVGKAKSGVRTEAQFSAVDRITDKIAHSSVGRFVGRTTLASAVAITYSLGAKFSQSIARSKLAAIGTFGATLGISAGLGAMRESHRTEEDRRQHFRDIAKGKKFNPDTSPRRKEMEEYRYHTEDASRLTTELESIVQRAEARGLTEEESQQAIVALAEADARIKISDLYKIDLISYSGATQVEQERTALDIARARAKRALRQAAAAGTVNLPEGSDIDSYVDSVSGTRMAEIVDGDEGIEEKNRAFKKMKHRRVAVAALKGAAWGLAFGTAFQEGFAFLRDNQQGLVEDLVGSGPNEVNQGASLTPLESLKLWLSGELHQSGGTLVEQTLPDGSIVKIPAGTELLPDPNSAGHYILSNDQGVIADGLVFENGHLTPASLAELDEHGVKSTSEGAFINREVTTTAASEDYVREHNNLFHRMYRELWYDNDTPKPIFDKNELRLDWGGQGGTGIDSNGNYVFNIERMMPDGSYHANYSIDAQQAMHGRVLKLALSLSRDTQRFTVEIPFDTHGNAVIPQNSEIAKLFFETTPDGKAHFIGRFAEVVQVVGHNQEDHGDIVRMLATYEGEGRENVTDTVTTPVGVPITTMDYADPQTDWPILIPPPSMRRSLEPLARGIEPIFTAGYYYGYRSFSAQEEKYVKERMSETIRNNPDAKLDPYKEVESYLDKQPLSHKEIVQRLAEEVGEMSPDCRAAICIPVAGHHEGENIYKTLENFLNQTADFKSFEIDLLVNMPEVDNDGKPVKPDSTMDEIKRFMKDHPELPVKVMEIVLPREDAVIGNIRKILNDAVLQRHHKRGSGVPDLIMVSNDADNKGLAPEYVENFIKKFDESANIEGLLGQTDWDPEAYVRNPLVHVGNRLFQYVDMQLRRKDRKMIGSQGPNFAFLSSIYSAVGGYSADFSIAEDMDLGRKIKYARDGSSTYLGLGYAGSRVSRLYTSARRAEKAVKDGLAPYEQWNRGFGAFDDEVRKVRWEDLGEKIDYDDPEYVAKLVKQLENIVNRTILQLKRWGASDDLRTIRRSLGWLGIKFIPLANGQIKITDAKVLIKGLKEYQTEGLRITKLKTTKATS